MASIGQALIKQVLGHSPAEKAFRPWWDNLEDFLVYGLITLGIIVAPTTIAFGTPLDCTFCDHGICDNRFNKTDTQPEDPGFNAWWVKKYCTHTAINNFILYFPYILLFLALCIVFIERVFVKIFKSGLKLDMFYNLIVREAIEDESSTGADANKHDSESGDWDLENTKAALEVSLSFSEGSNYWRSYFLRTFFEILMASTLMVWLCIYGIPTIFDEEFIYCDIHGHHYQCAGHPQQFYLYVLFMAIFLLFIYLLCCFYNILWLSFPNIGVLSSVMHAYRAQLKRQPECQGLSDREIIGGLHDVYFANRDLKLLLDLLAQSSGIAPAIRILTLFDKDFRALSQPGDLKVSPEGSDSVRVSFNEAYTMKEIFTNMDDVSVIYSVEILPPTANSSVTVFKSRRAMLKGNGYDKADGRTGRKYTKKDAVRPGDTTEMVQVQPDPHANECSFTGLDPAKEYKIRVCTIVNGRAVARTCKVIKAKVTTDPPNAPSEN